MLQCLNALIERQGPPQSDLESLESNSHGSQPSHLSQPSSQSHLSIEEEALYHAAAARDLFEPGRLPMSPRAAELQQSERFTFFIEPLNLQLPIHDHLSDGHQSSNSHTSNVLRPPKISINDLFD